MTASEGLTMVSPCLRGGAVPLLRGCARRPCTRGIEGRGGKTNKRIEFESNRKRIGSRFYGFGFDSAVSTFAGGSSVKLFVFGDSHVNTGNWPKDFTPWQQPYGITFPREPAGCFSSGRVLTDYIGQP
ncbi:hypothetical protein WN944_018776 [Citrus x changshan-huyou]|uniref:Uncharacterized protein n=1 Tax=Citrus x changshan-huyou TaxID=2935761 RepID=A0AAP0QDG5_9ROSI